jgi:hypothetical protein
MKNLTLSVDERVLKKARKVALELETTVNAMVPDFLGKVPRREAEKESARRRLLAMTGTFDCEIGPMPTREQRYARS